MVRSGRSLTKGWHGSTGLVGRRDGRARRWPMHIVACRRSRRRGLVRRPRLVRRRRGCLAVRRAHLGLGRGGRRAAGDRARDRRTHEGRDVRRSGRGRRRDLRAGRRPLGAAILLGEPGPADQRRWPACPGDLPRRALGHRPGRRRLALRDGAWSHGSDRPGASGRQGPGPGARA